MSKKNEAVHMLYACLGNVIFGFSFLFSKLALKVAEPFVLLSIRFVVAALLLTIVRFTPLVTVDLKGKDKKPLILLGLLQPVAYFICESYGLMYASSSFAGIMIALIPIAGLFLSFVILKEKPTSAQILFSIMSVGGVMFITLVGGSLQASVKGVIILIGAVISGAWFNIQSRKTAETFNEFERTYVMFVVAAVVFTVIAIITTKGSIAPFVAALTNRQFMISIIYLSFVSSVVAFILLNKSLNELPVAKSIVFSNVTTVISVLAGAFILQEPFTIVHAIGSIFVIVGVYGVVRSQNA